MQILKTKSHSRLRSTHLQPPSLPLPPCSHQSFISQPCTRTRALPNAAAAPTHTQSTTADLSRRAALLATTTLTLSTAVTVQPQPVWAAEDKVYLDVNLEGQSIGRIEIELFPDNAAVGAARFKDLAVGKEGVHYQLSRFDGIFPTHLRCNGVKSLSYSVSAESPIAGGDSVEQLEVELEKQQLSHDTEGLVSLIVKEAEERPIKERLVAKKGQLVTIAEQAGEAPNGTAFTISTAPGGDEKLNRTNLIVGRVVSGLDVVQKIAAQPFAKPRESAYDAPFFNAAKAMGDKRAVTAAKGFYRPLKRIIVADSGLV